MITPFTIGRLPRIEFGAGRIETLPEAILRHGRRVLLVTGARAFRASPHWSPLLAALIDRDLDVETAAVSGEPSPSLVDEIVRVNRAAGIEVVVGIGGGSVIDAAKAVAGLLRTGTSARDHLEGVAPQLPYPGPTVPFIAVPTTAGTGSEATRNAVLSEVGPGGFKRSFRDERLVAVEAIVDPDLLAGLPRESISANGMDAVTQLLEAYVSRRASPFTDALALEGLGAARDGLRTWHADPGAERAPAARSRMAWAALLSGVCLANAGLGVVHGLASPLGASFPIPHGAACGAVLVAGVRANIGALEAREPGSPALARFAAVGRVMGRLPEAVDDRAARHALVETLAALRDDLAIRGLGSWGVTVDDIDALVAGSRGSSMRTNPVELTDEEVAEVVAASI